MEYLPVKLFYEEMGEGFPVLLIHGFALDHTIWAPVASELKRKARIIMPDLRGHGLSPVSDEIYSMRLLAEDILYLLDNLSIERAVIVGHSLGGYVSLAFARAFPWRLAGVGLVASQASNDNPERRQDRYLMIDKMKRRGIKPLIKETGKKLTSDPELLLLIEQIMQRTNPVGAISVLKGMAERLDMTEELASIDIPAVIISGLQDLLIPRERSQTMAQLLNKGWLVELPRSGHLPMLENPIEVAAALLQLIQTAQ